MSLFKKNAASAEQKPVGFTKQKRFLFFKIKSKPIYQQKSAAESRIEELLEKQQKQNAPPQTAPQQKLTWFQMYVAKLLAKNKDLPIALKEQGIKSTPDQFVKKMLTNSIIVSAIIAATIIVVFIHYGFNIALTIILGAAIFYGMFKTFFARFINYPVAKGKNVGKEIERDILFAARDIVIGMRSGMPLFNAIVAVSTGYGAASREFAKIVERVELGMPIEQAIEEVSEKSESKTFKRIMLQASVSIKAGADIVGALQGVVEEVTQERVIDLRRYGQRLNALAMFYMLFGVIFPSMGIAVLAILTTFISLFTIDASTLVFVLIGIAFLQIIFLNIMRSSRPTFAM
ncbi:MAG: type II secretion system F family protein [Candidatus Micrarchaeaceae archaeon]